MTDDERFRRMLTAVDAMEEGNEEARRRKSEVARLVRSGIAMERADAEAEAEAAGDPGDFDARYSPYLDRVEDDYSEESRP